jgi:CHAT domain-containing protein
MRKLKICIITIAITFVGLSQPSDANVIAQCSNATYTLNLNPEICYGQFSSNFDRSIQSVSRSQNTDLQKLGIFFRQLGYLDKAKLILHQVLLNDPSNEQIQLSLANITRAEYLRAVSTFKGSLDTSSRTFGIDSGYTAAQNAFQQYELLYGSFQQPNEIKAALNWLRLWSELDADMPMVRDLRIMKQPQFFALAKRLSAYPVSLTNSEELEGKINLLETLSSVPNLPFELRNTSFKQVDLLIPLVQQSDKIRSLSRLLGVRSTLSQSVGDLDQAMADLKQAHSASLSIRAFDLSYRWEYLLGKLYAQRYDYAQAKNFFAASINSIKRIKDGSLPLKQEVQYGFFDKVEPIYREYLALLLSDEEPDFKTIIQTNENLQLDEIENYLQCGRLNTFSLLDLPPSQRPDGTIYFIPAMDRYEIILRSKDGSIRNHSVPRSTLDENVTLLRKYLSDARLKDTPLNILKAQFGTLYTSTLKPFEQWLPEKGTIVFVVDSKLQSIPWSALYDGHQFLIERFSIALSFGTEVKLPHQLSRNQMKVIAAGISETTQDSSFSPLPRVTEELNIVKKVFPSSKILLDARFTQENLERQGLDFPIVHLASHGKFSSNPSNTYILDWNGKIPLNQIERLLTERTLVPIELLVLSACETAKGDKRATLGIAGTAIKAGARSTIATLWSAEDNVTPKFMNDFYSAIHDGKTKAESLREAQIKVINDKKGKLANWANFVLFGSWL